MEAAFLYLTEKISSFNEKITTKLENWDLRKTQEIEGMFCLGFLLGRLLC